MTPTWSATATTLAGHQPPDLNRPFRLAWFGCRATFNPAVAAAVHPGAEMLAWDPDPTRIAEVRHLRDEAELSNLLVHEHPDLSPSAAGLFDMMVIDGLVDAVDDGRRAQLLERAVGLLRPGGMLCITFRTVVGWGEFVPVVRLLRHAVNRTSRDVATSVADAMVLLDIFREREVGYLSTRPMVRAWVDALLESTVDEVETEYVQRDLRPASHAQISQAVAMAGGSFIGSALLDDGLPDGVPEKLATLVNATLSQVLRASLTDLVLRRSFRADLFTLGGLSETPMVTAQRITTLSLAAFATDQRFVDQQSPMWQDRSPDAEPTIDQLGSGPQTVGELWAGASAKERQRQLRRALRSGHMPPARDAAPDPAAVDASARLAGTLNGAGMPQAHRHIVTPMAGSAVPAGLEDRDKPLQALDCEQP